MSDNSGGFNRRELLGATAATGLLSTTLFADKEYSSRPFAGLGRFNELFNTGRVDTNVHLFQWPFRRLPFDTTNTLLGKMLSVGLNRLLVGSFEALLHRDIAGVNARLVKECKDFLFPIGAVNPKLPNWDHDFQQCVDVHNMFGIRLYPNYHGYQLDDPVFLRLVDLAAKAERLIQIAVEMEDPRTQHPLVQVPAVDLSPLPRVFERVPKAKIQLLNYKPHPRSLAICEKLPNVFFDTARVDGTHGIAQLIERVSAKRVMFGSHAPFLIPDAGLIRLVESQLDEATLRAILVDNVSQLAPKVK